MAEEGGGSEQDDVSFLRTVKISSDQISISGQYKVIGNRSLSLYLNRPRLQRCPRVPDTGRHGLSVVHSDRRTCLPCGRGFRQSALFSREYRRQERAAGSVAVHVRHRTGAVRTSAAGVGHRGRFGIGKLCWVVFFFGFGCEALISPQFARCTEMNVTTNYTEPRTEQTFKCTARGGFGCCC